MKQGPIACLARPQVRVPALEGRRHPVEAVGEAPDLAAHRHARPPREVSRFQRPHVGRERPNGLGNSSTDQPRHEQDEQGRERPDEEIAVERPADLRVRHVERNADIDHPRRVLHGLVCQHDQPAIDAGDDRGRQSPGVRDRLAVGVEHPPAHPFLVVQRSSEYPAGLVDHGHYRARRQKGVGHQPLEVLEADGGEEDAGGPPTGAMHGLRNVHRPDLIAPREHGLPNHQSGITEGEVEIGATRGLEGIAIPDGRRRRAEILVGHGLEGQHRRESRSRRGDRGAQPGIVGARQRRIGVEGGREHGDGGVHLAQFDVHLAAEYRRDPLGLSLGEALVVRPSPGQAHHFEHRQRYHRQHNEEEDARPDAQLPCRRRGGRRWHGR